MHRAPITRFGVKSYESEALMRGAREQRVFFEVTPGAAVHVALLALDAGGKVRVCYPHPLWGDFGWKDALAPNVTLRMPPSSLQDDERADPGAAYYFLVPSASPIAPAAVASLRNELEREAAATPGEAIAGVAARLLRWLEPRHPGASMAELAATATPTR